MPCLSGCSPQKKSPVYGIGRVSRARRVSGSCTPHARTHAREQELYTSFFCGETEFREVRGGPIASAISAIGSDTGEIYSGKRYYFKGRFTMTMLNVLYSYFKDIVSQTIYQNRNTSEMYLYTKSIALVIGILNSSEPKDFRCEQACHSS